MNFSLFISWRYLYSKKKLKVINIISLISLIGIAVTTLSLLVVLSVFNGFTDIGEKTLSVVNPPLIIEPKLGKTLFLDSIEFEDIRNNPRLKAATPVITENALIVFGENQSIVEIRGINEEYIDASLLDTNLVLGEFKIREGGKDFSVLGIELFAGLNIPHNAELHGARLELIVPKRRGKISLNPEETFNNRSVFYAGSIQSFSALDESAVILSSEFAQSILDYKGNEYSSIHLFPKKHRDIDKIKKEIKKLVGENYEVKDVLEQEPIYSKVVRSERLGVYIILSFIIFIATFNIMGTLSLLIMDKEKDIRILRAMGANLSSIRRIYIYNGLYLSLIGGLIGLALGSIICLAQEYFGIIKMGAGNFIVDTFPIKLMLRDMVSILLLVVSIGIVAVSLLVKNKINNN